MSWFYCVCSTSNTSTDRYQTDSVRAVYPRFVFASTSAPARNKTCKASETSVHILNADLRNFNHVDYCCYMQRSPPIVIFNLETSTSLDEQLTQKQD